MIKQDPRSRHSLKPYIVIAIFTLAFVLRLVYLSQISTAPYFQDPAGDSKFLLERSLEIMDRDIIGKEVFFRSSPAYPYFIALVFAVMGRNFFLLGLIQILLGSFNCILIYVLARRVFERMPVAILAGIMASLYGLLAFFDADLLAIFLTLILVNSSLILFLDFLRNKKKAAVFAAGMLVGLAALDRTNILLFVLAAAVFLFCSMPDKDAIKRLKPAVLFVAGSLITILPMTARNYLVGRDLVLVSSNAGVNLYIGNNPEANGTFYLPPGSGLQNDDLEKSAEAIARRESGRDLKPSEVSRFWTKKAWGFISGRPQKTLVLYLRKFILFWNAYEIPNNLNFYFVRQNFAGVLKIMFIGFWLIAPLGLVSIVLQLKRGMNQAEKLLGIFLLTYLVSLLPFFITERYRLPAVPILVVFAAAAVYDIYRMIRSIDYKGLIATVLVLVPLAVFVNWPVIRFDDVRQRMIVGTRYLHRALQNPQANYQDFQRAIIELKWAVETDPFIADGHYQLARVYATIGYYAGALQELEILQQLDPGNRSVIDIYETVHEKFKELGNVIDPKKIPLTPYEQALDHGDRSGFASVVRTEPFHFQAWNSMALWHFDNGDYAKAIAVFKRGLAFLPDNPVLLYDLAKTYEMTGSLTKAGQVWSRFHRITRGQSILRFEGLFKTQFL